LFGTIPACLHDRARRLTRVFGVIFGVSINGRNIC